MATTSVILDLNGSASATLKHYEFGPSTYWRSAVAGGGSVLNRAQHAPFSGAEIGLPAGIKSILISADKNATDLSGVQLDWRLGFHPRGTDGEISAYTAPRLAFGQNASPQTYTFGSGGNSYTVSASIISRQEFGKTLYDLRLDSSTVLPSSAMQDLLRQVGIEYREGSTPPTHQREINIGVKISGDGSNFQGAPADQAGTLQLQLDNQPLTATAAAYNRNVVMIPFGRGEIAVGSAIEMISEPWAKAFGEPKAEYFQLEVRPAGGSGTVDPTFAPSQVMLEQEAFVILNKPIPAGASVRVRYLAPVGDQKSHVVQDWHGNDAQTSDWITAQPLTGSTGSALAGAQLGVSNDDNFPFGLYVAEPEDGAYASLVVKVTAVNAAAGTYTAEIVPPQLLDNPSYDPLAPAGSFKSFRYSNELYVAELKPKVGGSLPAMGTTFPFLDLLKVATEPFVLRVKSSILAAQTASTTSATRFDLAEEIIGTNLPTSLKIGSLPIGDDTFIGSNGNDTFEGWWGNDSLSGGAGDDRYIIRMGTGSDRINDSGGSADVIELRYSFNSDLPFRLFREGTELRIRGIGEDVSIVSNVWSSATGTTAGAGWIETLVLSNTDDDGNTVLTRTLSLAPSGSAANDWVVGTTAGDTLSGGDGLDFLHGDLGNDSLSGGNGNDNLRAGAGNDTLIGGPGNDVLRGGDGLDIAVLPGERWQYSIRKLSSAELANQPGEQFGYRVQRTSDGQEALSNGEIDRIYNTEGLQFDDELVFVGGTAAEFNKPSGTVVRIDPDSQITSPKFFYEEFGGWSDRFVHHYGPDVTETFVKISNDQLEVQSTWFDYREQHYDPRYFPVFPLGAGAPPQLRNIYLLTGPGIGNTTSWDEVGAQTGLNFSAITQFAEWRAAATSTTTTRFKIQTVESTTGTLFDYTFDQLSVLSGRGNDSFSGSLQGDQIFGFGGSDQLNGRAGNDTIYGDGTEQLRAQLGDGWTSSDGQFVDSFEFQDGNDSINGGEGNDLLNGGDGDDLIIGGAGNDTLIGGSGYNALLGEAGNDSLIGSEDDDFLSGGDGNDTLSGGENFDIAIYNFSARQSPVNFSITAAMASGGHIYVGNQSDGNGGTDSLQGLEQILVLGGNVSDSLTGGSGSDVLGGRAGNDALNGGPGFDAVIYYLSGAAVTVDLNTGTATGEGSDTLTSIEGVWGSFFDDVIVGSSQANFIEGGPGNDSLSGGAGNDEFYFDARRVNLNEGWVGRLIDALEVGQIRQNIGFTQQLSAAEFDTITDFSLGDTIVSDDPMVRVNKASNQLLAGEVVFEADTGGGSGTPAAKILIGKDAAPGADLTIRLPGVQVTALTLNVEENTIELVDPNAVTGPLNLSRAIDPLDNAFFSNSKFFYDSEAAPWLNRYSTPAKDAQGNDLDPTYTAATNGESARLAFQWQSYDQFGIGRSQFFPILPTGANVLVREVHELQGINLDKVNPVTFIADPSATLSSASVLIEWTNNGGTSVIKHTVLSDAFLSNASLQAYFDDSEDLFSLAGNDTLSGSRNADTINGRDGNDSILGRDGDDYLEGGPGSDTLFGGNGSDILLGFQDYDDSQLSNPAFKSIVDGQKTVADYLYGGPGNDLYAFDQFVGRATVVELSDEGIDTISGDLPSYALSANVENYINDLNLTQNGVPVQIPIEGNSLNNVLQSSPESWELPPSQLIGSVNQAFTASEAFFGKEGHDTILAGGGDDALDGGDGTDLLDGGNGNDLLSGQSGSDLLFGRAGSDTLNGGAGSNDAALYAFYDQTQARSFQITASFDAISGSWSGSQADGFGGTDQLSNIEVIYVVGGSGADSIVGGSGLEFIEGGPGNDTLSGGAGGGGVVSYMGATGPVSVDFSIGAASGAHGNDTLSNFHSLFGSTYGDTLKGNSGENFLRGQSGNDTLTGAGGNDSFKFDTRPITVESFKTLGGVALAHYYNPELSARITSISAFSETDQVTDFGPGDRIEFSDPVTIVTTAKETLTAGQMRMEPLAAGMNFPAGAILFIGRDSVPGVDLTIQLPGVGVNGLTLGDGGMSVQIAQAPSDTTPPSIELKSDKTSLKANETATITFTLSEPSSDFTPADVEVNSGTLTNFTGSGKNYTATYIPAPSSTGNAVINVASGTFSDAAGNLNADGADVNNSVILSVDTRVPSGAPQLQSVQINAASQSLTLTFSEPVIAGFGYLFLRQGANAGQVVESFRIIESDRLSFSGNTVTLVPTVRLTPNSSYHLSGDSGVLVDSSQLPVTNLQTGSAFTTSPVATTLPFNTATALAVPAADLRNYLYAGSGEFGTTSFNVSGHSSRQWLGHSTFEGQFAYRVDTDTTQTITGPSIGSQTITAKVSEYYGEDYRYVGHSTADSYIVVGARASLPPNFSVGNAGDLYTTAEYSNSTKAVLNHTSAYTFAIEPDTPGSAILSLTATDKSPSGQTLATTTQQFSITPAGGYLLLQASAEETAGPTINLKATPASVPNTGHVYHWKSHVLMNGVSLEVSNPAVAAPNAQPRLIDFKNIRVDPFSGDVTAEVWAQSDASFQSVSLEFAHDSGLAFKFTPNATTLGDWQIVADSDIDSTVFVAVGLEALAGEQKLGSILMAAGMKGAGARLSLIDSMLGGTSVRDITLAVGGPDGTYWVGPENGSRFLNLSKAPTSDAVAAITSADVLAALKIAARGNPNPDPDGPGRESPAPVSPYQLIAADVNQNGRVDGDDALSILKMALQRDDAPETEWWFVRENRDFYDEATGRFTTDRKNIPLQRSGDTVALDDGAAVNWVATLKGDVDGSWSPQRSEISRLVPEPELQALAIALGVPVNQWGLEIDPNFAGL